MKAIQIKNNITYDTVEKHLRRLKEDEEKERQERYASTAHYQPSYFRINFYEWSNMDSTPKVFQTTFAFFKFLKECGISYTEAQRTNVYNAKSVIYATCSKGTPTLLIGTTISGLRALLNMSPSMNLPAVLATVNPE